MRRRDFLQRGLATTTMLASRGLTTACPPLEGRRVRVFVNPHKTIAVTPPDFIGLGYEISSVARPGLFSEHNAQYVKLVRALGSQGVIRIGGNTSDYSSYSPWAQPLVLVGNRAGLHR